MLALILKVTEFHGGEDAQAKMDIATWVPRLVSKLHLLLVSNFSGYGAGLDMGLQGQADQGYDLGQTRSAVPEEGHEPR